MEEISLFNRLGHEEFFVPTEFGIKLPRVSAIIEEDDDLLMVRGLLPDQVIVQSAVRFSFVLQLQQLNSSHL